MYLMGVIMCPLQNTLWTEFLLYCAWSGIDFPNKCFKIFFHHEM